MSDSFTRVTHESWLSRIGQSIKGVVVGLLLVAISFPLLFWNEGRAVTTARSLAEGAKSVIDVPADRVDPSHEGKLVHVAATATTDETLADSDFGVSANALKLVREVEMYQWDEDKRSETQKKLGGGTETVTRYAYSKRWADHVIDSSRFEEPSGHQNPSRMPVESTTVYAKHAKLGAFSVGEEELEKLSNGEKLRVDSPKVRSVAGHPVTLDQGVVYLGESGRSPEVGTVRVQFKAFRPGPMSVVAQQVNGGFAPYQIKGGDALLLVADGIQTADAMFKEAETTNTIITWVLRFVGWFLMFVGLAVAFKPISVLGDVVPFIGSVVGAGLAAFAFLVSSALSLVTVAIAWLYYRPLLGIGLLVGAGAAIYGLITFSRSRKKPASAPPARRRAA